MSHLSNEQHISQDLLLRYVEDDCSRLEMRAIDRHLATCPMCSDAVEGLMLLSEPSVAVADLNKKIDIKVAEKIAEKTTETPLKTPANLSIEPPVLEVVKRPFWQQRWAAAAAILLLFSGSFWFYKNTQMRDNQSVAHSENAVLNDSLDNRTPQYKTDFEHKKGGVSTPLITPNSGVNSGTNNGELAQLEDNKKVVLRDDFGTQNDVVSNAKTPETATKPSADIAVAEPRVEAEKVAPAPASAPVVYAPQTDRTRDYAGASNVNIVPRPTTSAPTKSEDIAVTKVEANRTYDNKNGDKKREEIVVTGATAAKKYDTSKAPAAKKDPSVSDQILSRADDNFKQKKYETAVVEYTQFLSIETSGDRYERALFQVASGYLKLNKKAEAKVIFEKLSAMDGQYQRAAKKALKDL